MRFSRLLSGTLSLAMLAPVFMLSGCIVDRDRDRDRSHEPTEGYYDRDNHRYYHEHAWVVCDARDPHCGG